MNRITPDETRYKGRPCSFVAVGTAVDDMISDPTEKPAVLPPNGLRPDGYLTLDDMNRYIRSYFTVIRRYSFKRGERPKLKELKLTRPAIVTVIGHHLFMDGDMYWSFYDNSSDEVVSAWLLGGLNEVR